MGRQLIGFLFQLFLAYYNIGNLTTSYASHPMCCEMHVIDSLKPDCRNPSIDLQNEVNRTDGILTDILEVKSFCCQTTFR